MDTETKSRRSSVAEVKSILSLKPNIRMGDMHGITCHYCSDPATTELYGWNLMKTEPFTRTRISIIFLCEDHSRFFSDGVIVFKDIYDDWWQLQMSSIYDCLETSGGGNIYANIFGDRWWFEVDEPTFLYLTQIWKDFSVIDTPSTVAPATTFPMDPSTVHSWYSWNTRDDREPG